MAVRVVTDSSAGLPEEIVAELGIGVIELHVMDGEGKDGTEQSTSGVSAIELAAFYGRQMERAAAAGGEEAVLAIHLSKELSSTYSSAVTASGAFAADALAVIDSGSTGMSMGAAVMAAARLAQDGADLAECRAAAEDTLARSNTWVYLSSTDDLRRSGRMSTATAMLSTALLATKPIMELVHGKVDLVGKTRTQTKAFTKLVELAVERAGGEPAFVAIQHNGDEEAAERLQDLLDGALPEGSSFMLLPLGGVLSVHVGSGAIGVSAVFATETPVSAPKPKNPLGTFAARHQREQ
ncbi:DegV family protein [Corynebacterium sp. HMSC04H06]|uniref:DegV family protein n=1 Tax=Corynebacterium sp. HMSC04H06 TaxID=1581050 RepID=UPI0008A63108|nr:DegV family protein [Corynebacterium sp. HMSC04H06]